MKNQTKLFLIGAIMTPWFANATTMYENNITALNINMLTDTFMSYTHRGDNLSDFFERPNLYGEMTRVDEYGDNGMTIPMKTINTDGDKFLFKNVWADIKHINSKTHYGNSINARPRMNLVAIGTETSDIKLKKGNIAFGGFGGYINTSNGNVNSNGNTVGIFSHYKNKHFDTVFLINNGSINNNYDGHGFNNSWFNVMIDASTKIKIFENLHFQPQIYAGYTWVSSDNFYLNNDIISANNFSIFNVAPSARFVKHIAKNFYGAIQAKYVATFGDGKDIYVNDLKTAKTNIDNYTQIGIDLEYDFKNVVLTGAVSKQMGGFDSWIGNISIKYNF